MKKLFSVLILASVSLQPLYAGELSDKIAKLQQNCEKEDAISCGQLGYIYLQQRRYSEAEPVYQRNIAILEKTFDKNDPVVASLGLAKLLELYINQGRYSEADPLYERILATFEKSVDKNSVETGVSLDYLAQLYQKQGKFEQAELGFLRRLQFKEKKLGQDHPEVAKSLDTLADMYLTQANYQQANALYLRSLAIREKTFGKEQPEIVKSLNDLAELYIRQGRYSTAEAFLQKGLIIREKGLGKNHPDVANNLNLLASLYQKQGKYDLAEPLLIRITEITEKNFSKYQAEADAAKTVLSKNNVATLTNFFELANTVTQSICTIGELYNKQGKYQQAESSYRKALAFDEKISALIEKIFGKYQLGNVDELVTASIWGILANNYYDQGKYAQAESLYLKTLAFFEKNNLISDNTAYATHILSRLAMLYDAQGKYAQAEPLYLRQLAILEKALAPEDLNISKVLKPLAKHYRLQGKYAEAESSGLRSLAILEKNLDKDHPDIAKNLNELARLYSAKADYGNAEPLLKRSLRLMNQSLEHWLWGASESTRQSYLQTLEKDRNFYLSFYNANNNPEEAFYFSLSRKGLLLRISSEMNALAKQNPDPAIQKQAEEFNALKVQLANLAFSDKPKEKARIQSLEEKINTLEMQLSQKVASFKRSNTEVTPAEVLEKLKPEQAIVDFLVYQDLDFKSDKEQTEQVVALVADKQNGIKLIKLDKFASISNALTRYRQSIEPRNRKPGESAKDYTEYLGLREESLNYASQDLYKSVWLPLAPYLANTTEVYVIPDGILHLFPFKALKDEKGHYLAESKQITLLSSARDIVLPPLTGRTSNSIIFAAPDYGKTTDKAKTATANRNRSVATRQEDIYFVPLQAAAVEGKTLSKLIGTKQPVQLFQNKQASEAQVDSIKAPRILHLATHGFFLADKSENNQNPLTRSGLALTNANFGIKGQKQADGTDGILTALEVLGLNLEGTDLVTLSACETGVGDIQVGEGVYSLNRAFQEAGAKNVLSTLWSVADEQTQQFMQNFYTLVLNGDSPQQALQKTQLKFINDKALKDPFFWAAFTVVGI